MTFVNSCSNFTGTLSKEGPRGQGPDLVTWRKFGLIEPIYLLDKEKDEQILDKKHMLLTHSRPEIVAKYRIDSICTSPWIERALE